MLERDLIHPDLCAQLRLGSNDSHNGARNYWNVRISRQNDVVITRDS